MKTNLFVLLLFLVSTSVQLLAQETDVFQKDGIAIRGYDPVAYFKQSKPVKGQETISHDWNGVKWLFSSEETRKISRQILKSLHLNLEDTVLMV
jgi:hypothetical protein